MRSAWHLRAHRRLPYILVGTLLAASCLGVTGLAAAPDASAFGGRHGATYVALGDSYASGEGLGAYEPGTDVKKGVHRNQCHRSVHAYATLTPGVVLPRVHDRAFWACAGATSTDMTMVPPQSGPNMQYQQPRQTDTVGNSTRWISISAGGNDLKLFDIGKACAVIVVNHTRILRLPGKRCDRQIEDSRNLIDSTRKNLAKLYDQLLTRAPNAVLAVVGYPRIFPSSYYGVPRFNGKEFCILNHYPVPHSADVGVWVSVAKDVDAFIVEMNTMVEDAISDIRQRRSADADRIRYVETYSTSTPRNCKGTTPNASVNGVMLSAFRGIGPKEKLLISSATFHPTRAGQRMLARRVQETFERSAAVNRWTATAKDLDRAFTSPIGDTWVASPVGFGGNTTVTRYRPNGTRAGPVVDLPIYLQSLGFAPDGTGYAIGFADPAPGMAVGERLLRIDATGGWVTLATWNYPNYQGGSQSVRVGPDGKLYVFGLSALRVIDPETGAETQSVEVPPVTGPALAPRHNALHLYDPTGNAGEVRPYTSLATPITQQPPSDAGVPRADVADDGSLLLTGDWTLNGTQACTTGHIVNFAPDGSTRYAVPWITVAGSFSDGCHVYGGAALSGGRSVVGYALDGQARLVWINPAGHVEARTLLPTDAGWKAADRGDLAATAGDGVAVAFTETNPCDFDTAGRTCAKIRIYAASRSGVVDTAQLQGDGDPNSPRRFVAVTHHHPQLATLHVGTGYVVLETTYKPYDCGSACIPYGGAEIAHDAISLSVGQRLYQSLL